jgi:hypothetical protein
LKVIAFLLLGLLGVVLLFVLLFVPVSTDVTSDPPRSDSSPHVFDMTGDVRVLNPYVGTKLNPQYRAAKEFCSAIATPELGLLGLRDLANPVIIARTVWNKVYPTEPKRVTIRGCRAGLLEHM